jgi:hypothetical protein
MAVINPPGWLQNAGATHTAEQMRNFVYASEDVLTVGSLLPKSGVAWGKGDSLLVTQTGSPSMAVIVKSGTAEIAGTESSKQGAYGVMNDADFTISITAAHATLPRIDIIVFKVEDSQYSGSNNTSSLVVVDGTPAGSPSAPSPPANSTTIAQIAVGAAVSSIVNANITDKRTFLGHGIFPVVSSGDLPAAGIDGRYRDRTDTNVLERDSSAAWEKIADPTVFTILTNYAGIAWTSTGTAPALGNGTLVAASKQVGKLVFYILRLTWGSTTTGGTGTWQFTVPFLPSTGNQMLPGYVRDNSAAVVHPSVAHFGSGSNPVITSVQCHNASGVVGVVTATHPFTWAVSDVLYVAGTYESI